MRKHGGTPSWRDKHVTLAAISPPGVARGRFVGGQQSGLAGSKPPPLFTRGASSCSSQGRRQGEPWGASPRPSAPTYLPASCHSWLGCWGCVCVCGGAPLLPCHSWLGCVVWACVLGLEFQLRPATPGWGVGVCLCLWVCSPCTPSLLAGVCGVGMCAWAGVWAVPRHSWLGCCGVCVFVGSPRWYPTTPGWVVAVCVCWLARPACTPPLLAGVCGVGVCAWAWVSAAPRHPWLGCWGVCVFVGAPRLYPATAGWGVRCGCVCLGSGSGCAPPLLAGMLGGVCVCVRAPLVPRHSSLGCAVWVCVLWLRFRLHPAPTGWVVGVCLCLGFLGAPRLYPATPGWGVRCGCLCLGLGFGCSPPLLAGVFGCVCVCGGAPLVPRHSWLGFCGVGVCVWARVSAAPCHSWLGCWTVFVFVGVLRLYPATPGWGVRCGYVCLGWGLHCAPPLLAWMLRCVCVCGLAPLVLHHSWLACCGVCVLVGAAGLYPATPGRGVRCWCVCLGLGFGCVPTLLAGLLGRVCVCGRAPLVPRHIWLGCALWVCVLGLGFRLRPATPG